MQSQDASTFQPELTIDSDVCIVGSGAAAISLAHRLIGTNLRVVLLESSAAERTKRQPCAGAQLMTVTREMTTSDPTSCHRYVDEPAQSLFVGQVSPGVTQFDRNFLTRSRVRVYGGTTNCWGGWTRTLDASDFTRTQLGGPWPITYGEMEPWYREAQWLCSLGDPDNPQFPLSVYNQPDWLEGKTTPTVKPISFTAQSKVRTGILTTLHRNGSVDNGLDFQLLWGPKFDNTNVQVIRNANVRYFDHNDGAVTRAVVQTLTSEGAGLKFYARAKIFVLAAGGIETVRLMLLSKLPDPSGKLGKGFMVHPLNDWPYPAAEFSWTGRVPPAVDNLYSSDVHLANPGPTYNTAFRGVLVPTDALLNTGIGNFRAMVNFSGSVNVNWEQKPDDTNLIRLSDKTDVFKDRQVDLQWSIKQSDWDTLRAAVKAVGDELTNPSLGYAANYRYTVDEQNPKFLMGDHPMGATRMAATSGKGVVDKNCAVFGTNNLFVASSSVFPQTGWSNPTLTIVALARRLAGHIQGLLT